jgi:hypothetical protein
MMILNGHELMDYKNNYDDFDNNFEYFELMD